MQRFRILHCLRAPLGGLFRHVRDLAQEQVDAGHALGIVCDATSTDRLTGGQLKDLAAICELGVHRTPMSRLISHHDPMALRRTIKFAREGSFNVLHGHGAKGGLYARIASRYVRQNSGHAISLYTPHGGTLNYRPGSLTSRFFLHVERKLLPLTDGLCFESQYAFDKFRQLVCEPDCEARVIPNGVGSDEFFTHEPNDNAADFVFVGELREIKGVDVLLQALARLNEARNATALIVGDGPDLEKLEALTRSLNLQNNVRFPGAMPARKAFVQGKTLVIPSRAESFPYIVLEAAAFAIPMLVTRVGGIPEITGPDDPFLLPDGDISALHKALQEAMDRPHALRERTLALQERVRTQFSTAGMARSVLDLYELLSSKA